MSKIDNKIKTFVYKILQKKKKKTSQSHKKISINAYKTTLYAVKKCIKRV